MAVKPHKCRLVATFGANVRARRGQLGISQEELAERSGLHRTYIGMIERCEKNVTIYNIERISRALNVSAADMLCIVAPVHAKAAFSARRTSR